MFGASSTPNVVLLESIRCKVEDGKIVLVGKTENFIVARFQRFSSMRFIASGVGADPKIWTRVLSLFGGKPVATYRHARLSPGEPRHQGNPVVTGLIFYHVAPYPSRPSLVHILLPFQIHDRCACLTQVFSSRSHALRGTVLPSSHYRLGFEDASMYMNCSRQGVV